MPIINYNRLARMHADLSAPKSRLEPTYRRMMPSFCIRDWSVLRFIPSMAAAPLGPPTTQLEASSASMMWRLSASSIVRTATEAGFRDSCRSSLGMVRRLPEVRMTERSTIFRSSRILPGQE